MADNQNDSGLDTGISKDEEIAMGFRTPDGKPVDLPTKDNTKSGLAAQEGGGVQGDDHSGSDNASGSPDGQSNDNGTASNTSNDIPEAESATAAQKAYINTMAVEAHEEIPFELTKDEASEKIAELQQKTGRTDDTLAPS